MYSHGTSPDREDTREQQISDGENEQVREAARCCGHGPGGGGSEEVEADAAERPGVEGGAIHADGEEGVVLRHGIYGKECRIYGSCAAASRQLNTKRRGAGAAQNSPTWEPNGVGTW